MGSQRNRLTVRGLTGRSRWGSEQRHIAPVRGSGWGAIISATGGVHSGGGNSAGLVGGDWHMAGVQLVIMERPATGEGSSWDQCDLFSFFSFSFL